MYAQSSLTYKSVAVPSILMHPYDTALTSAVTPELLKISQQWKGNIESNK